MLLDHDTPRPLQESLYQQLAPGASISMLRLPQVRWCHPLAELIILIMMQQVSRGAGSLATFLSSLPRHGHRSLGGRFLILTQQAAATEIIRTVRRVELQMSFREV